MSKICSKCKEKRDVKDYYKNPQCGTKDGLNSWCKYCHKKAKRKYYHQVIKKDLEKVRAYRRKWREKNKDRAKELSKKSYEKLRRECLKNYSNEEIKCACCGEKEYKFLGIDHVYGDGNKHRKKIGRGGLYQWLRNNNYPKGFQVLCHNCNFAKGHYGECPHYKLNQIHYEKD